MEAEPGASEVSPADLGMPAPVTGVDSVDEAIGRLGDLAGLAVTEHPEVFEDVHRRLARALGAAEGSGPATPEDERSRPALGPPHSDRPGR